MEISRKNIKLIKEDPEEKIPEDVVFPYDEPDCVYGGAYAFDTACDESEDGDEEARWEKLKKKEIGSFIYIDGMFVFYICEICDAVEYGNYLACPISRWEFFNVLEELQLINPWDDVDSYPRGRVIFRQSDQTFLIYYDSCLDDHFRNLAWDYLDYNVIPIPCPPEYDYEW